MLVTTATGRKPRKRIRVNNLFRHAAQHVLYLHKTSEVEKSYGELTASFIKRLRLSNINTMRFRFVAKTLASEHHQFNETQDARHSIRRLS